MYVCITCDDHRLLQLQLKKRQGFKPRQLFNPSLWISEADWVTRERAQHCNVFFCAFSVISCSKQFMVSSTCIWHHLLCPVCKFAIFGNFPCAVPTFGSTPTAPGTLPSVHSHSWHCARSTSFLWQ